VLVILAWQTRDVLSTIMQTTAYILSPDRASVLLIHRNKCPDDVHFGKYLGIGGHVEPDEDVVTCIRREVAEETGLTVSRAAMRGTVIWTGFGSKLANITCFVFRVDSYDGEPHGGNEEGTLEWVPLADLRRVPLWDSDHEWLPMVFDDDTRQFHGIMPYENGAMKSWSYQRI
jgi:8-oxo-dGTP diphosphatase